MKDKRMSLEDFQKRIPDGAVIMVSGFLGDGTPETLIDALLKGPQGNFTLIANDTAFSHKGIGKLIVARKVRKVIVSHIGTNPETQKQMIEGSLDVSLVPQGTLAEQIRAGGFGLGGILTPTGVGTLVENGKPKITLEGKEYLVEKALKADFALIKAKKADFYGNCTFNFTAQNFNSLMPFACSCTICEVQEMVPVGGLSPNEIQLPHAVVDFLVKGGAQV
ncbi:MAG TPA: 3-oxoacid CoA-transferase subunit A [Thermotogota bacterium]|nr:3-oxoacid CoA-transferase subunit A [Thermotogota bacterium]HRW91718.1 3-oxoacid CoA-transferase subunit A [Thermotogota bacterium]